MPKPFSAVRQQITAGEQSLREAYEKRPLAVQMLRGRARLIDSIVIQLWQKCGLAENATLVAVGGYGRGELFPHSDIDLTILLPEDGNDKLHQNATALLHALWDTGLQIGHSVRTPSEALAASGEDITIQTSLLEARCLTGNHALFTEFAARYHASLDIPAFYKAKRLEQEQRHASFNDSPFALEPNVKESPGGLRDLQLLAWIARAVGVGARWRDLARESLITTSEAAALRKIRQYLYHLRIRLHYLCKRCEDRLLFDYQEELAAIMGLRGDKGRRASESLMQRYYLTAKKNLQISTILRLNYGNLISPPSQAGRIRPINAHFQARGEYLDIRHSEVFRQHPSALLECFLLLQQHPELKGMTVQSLRALWQNRNRINASFRADPENRALFLKILLQTRGVMIVLSRMNKYELLGNYLPAWRQIVGQMQHDLFHVYTVDQHILLVLRNLRNFGHSEHAHEYPLMSRLWLNFDKPYLLNIAALFHDIAKGRGGDHSRLGSTEALQFCRQHLISDEDSQLVAWLVKQHLSMSQVAQKQDISDPKVIERFADQVGSEQRLIALYLLTHADIRGTSPKVWNNWRATLLENLFRATSRLLCGETAQQALGFDNRQESARQALRQYGLPPGAEDNFWMQLDSVYFMRHSPEEIAWHTCELAACPSPEQPAVKARILHAQHDNIQIMVYSPDQADLFVRLTGFLGRIGFSILDAKVHTTAHKFALDSFVLQNINNNTVDADTLRNIERELSTHLQQDGTIVAPGERWISRQLKHFPVSPRVSLLPDEAGGYHILSLTATDKPNLLFHIAQILARHQIRIHTAKIATLGDRAEDTFLLSGAALAQGVHVLEIKRELFDLLGT